MQLCTSWPGNFFHFPGYFIQVSFYFSNHIQQVLKNIAGVEGLEPSAYGFGDRRSAN